MPGGGNQPVGELLGDYREPAAEERLGQTAKLSEMATGLATGQS